MLPTSLSAYSLLFRHLPKAFWVLSLGITVIFLSLQTSNTLFYYQRELITQGQWWRLWTGQWVHTNSWHLILNLLGTYLVLWLSPSFTKITTFISDCLLLASGIAIGLWWFSPTIQWYMGFSGILYGLYWLYALNLTQQDKWGWVLPAILLFKVNWDIYHQGNSSTSDLIQAPIIYAAHIYGILTATLIALPNRLYVYYQQTKKTLV